MTDLDAACLAFLEGCAMVKLRYTLPSLDEFREPASAAAWAKSVETLGDLFKTVYGTSEGLYYATGGYEWLNKDGEQTHPHIHLHFAFKTDDQDKLLGTIRKRFQRWSKDDPRKGNALYSLALEKDIKDYKRFFRYPWKQSGRVVFVGERVPPSMRDEVEKHVEMAQEEQRIVWDVRRKKKEKAMQPGTKEILFDYLDRINDDHKFGSQREILIEIIKFYNQEEKSANKNTIMGFLQTAMWRYGLETFEATADKWLRE